MALRQASRVSIGRGVRTSAALGVSGRTSVLAVATILSLSSVASCGASACSEAGGEGGFTIHLAVPSYRPLSGDTITGCAAGTCGTVAATDADPFVANDALTVGSSI